LNNDFLVATRLRAVVLPGLLYGGGGAQLWYQFAGVVVVGAWCLALFSSTCCRIDRLTDR